MLDDKNLHHTFFNLEDNPIVAHAQFSISLQRAPKRFTIEIRVRGETFLDCAADFFFPFSRKIGNVVRNHQVMINDSKGIGHDCRMHYFQAFVCER